MAAMCALGHVVFHKNQQLVQTRASEEYTHTAYFSSPLSGSPYISLLLVLLKCYSIGSFRMTVSQVVAAVALEDGRGEFNSVMGVERNKRKKSNLQL